MKKSYTRIRLALGESDTRQLFGLCPELFGAGAIEGPGGIARSGIGLRRWRGDLAIQKVRATVVDEFGGGRGPDRSRGALRHGLRDNPRVLESGTHRLDDSLREMAREIGLNYARMDRE